MATKDLLAGFAVPPAVCWADKVLAKLGDLIALVATTFHKRHPDRIIPGVLLAQRQLDVLKAAIQLPGMAGFEHSTHLT